MVSSRACVKVKPVDVYAPAHQHFNLSLLLSSPDRAQVPALSTTVNESTSSDAFQQNSDSAVSDAVSPLRRGASRARRGPLPSTHTFGLRRPEVFQPSADGAEEWDQCHTGVLQCSEPFLSGGELRECHSSGGTDHSSATAAWGSSTRGPIRTNNVEDHPESAGVDEKKSAKSCCSSLIFILAALALASGVLACAVVQILSKSRAASEDGAVVGGAPTNTVVSSSSAFIAPAAPTMERSALETVPTSTSAAAAPAQSTISSNGEDEYFALSTTLAPTRVIQASTGDPTPTATSDDDPGVALPTVDAVPPLSSPLDPATAADSPTEDPRSNPLDDDAALPPAPLSASPSIVLAEAAVRIQARVKGSRARADLRHQAKCALQIQSAYKGSRARKQVRQERNDLLLRGKDSHYPAPDIHTPAYPAFAYLDSLFCPRGCGCNFMDISLSGAHQVKKEKLLADHLFSCRAGSTIRASIILLPDQVPVTGAESEEDHVFRSGGSNLIERQEPAERSTEWGVCPNQDHVRGSRAYETLNTEEDRARGAAECGDVLPCPRGCGARFRVHRSCSCSTSSLCSCSGGNGAYENHLLGMDAVQQRAAGGDGSPLLEQGGCHYDFFLEQYFGFRPTFILCLFLGPTLPDMLVSPALSCRVNHVFRTGAFYCRTEYDRRATTCNGSNFIEYDGEVCHWKKCPRGCGAEFCVFVQTMRGGVSDNERGRRAFRNHLEHCREGLSLSWPVVRIRRGDSVQSTREKEEDHVFRTGGSNLIRCDSNGCHWKKCPRGCGAEFCVFVEGESSDDEVEGGRKAFRNHLEQCREGLLESDGRETREYFASDDPYRTLSSDLVLC